MKIIAVYADDLILIAKSLSEIQQMKDSLSKTFKMKIWDNFAIVLAQGISLCQKQYLIKLLKRYKLIITEANTVTMPMDPNVKLVGEG